MARYFRTACVIIPLFLAKDIKDRFGTLNLVEPEVWSTYADYSCRFLNHIHLIIRQFV